MTKTKSFKSETYFERESLYQRILSRNFKKSIASTTKFRSEMIVYNDCVAILSVILSIIENTAAENRPSSWNQFRELAKRNNMCPEELIVRENDTEALIEEYKDRVKLLRQITTTAGTKGFRLREEIFDFVNSSFKIQSDGTIQCTKVESLFPSQPDSSDIGTISSYASIDVINGPMDDGSVDSRDRLGVSGESDSVIVKKAAEQIEIDDVILYNGMPYKVLSITKTEGSIRILADQIFTRQSDVLDMSKKALVELIHVQYNRYKIDSYDSNEMLTLVGDGENHEIFPMPVGRLRNEIIHNLEKKYTVHCIITTACGKDVITSIHVELGIC